MYHVFASAGGVVGGVVGASILETAIAYGSETCNAQMATNNKAPGTFPNVHRAFVPFGPGVSLHILRNVLATAGLRMFCGPATAIIEGATGKSNEMTALAGSFGGNVLSACMTAPVHQAYGFCVTTPEYRSWSSNEKASRMQQYLKAQYFNTDASGKSSLKATVARDMFMRSMYVAVAYTMFSTIERGLVKMWPK
jgi:hypothetical protein